MFKEFNSLHDFDGVTETQCVEHYRDLRWPNGPICPHCGSAAAPYELRAVGHYKCSEKECSKKFSWRRKAHGTCYIASVKRR